MSTILRSSLVALALIGTVSTVSAAPREAVDYGYGNAYTSGTIDNFNRLAHKED